jgi:hypothetical protein
MDVEGADGLGRKMLRRIERMIAVFMGLPLAGGFIAHGVRRHLREVRKGTRSPPY